MFRTTNKSLNVLIARVKAVSPQTVAELNVSSVVLDRVLAERPISELRSLAKTDESLLSELKSLKKGIRPYVKVAKENKALIKHFETAYSKSVFQTVYEALPASKRSQIESGLIRLSDFTEELRKRCDEIAKPSPVVGTLPSQEDMTEFFKTAKVVKYESGYQGVFFVEGPYKGEVLRLVVKGVEKPAQESYGTDVVSSLGMKTPASKVISNKDRTLFPEVLKALKKHPEYQEHYKKNAPTQLCIMSYISGVTLEKLSASEVEETLKENPKHIYDKMLFDIGEIAAADFLLYYQDRLPTIGMGNLANLMIQKDENNKCVGAVAIDQVAYLSSEHSSITLMKIDPFARIEGLVSEIVSNPEEISGPARNIFEDAIPEGVRELLDERQALLAIHNGILSGLSKIVTCSEERLRSLHTALPTTTNPRDTVDLDAHHKMLSTIKTTVLANS